MKGLKTGGRQPGSLNRVTQEIRNKLRTLVEANINTLEEDFKTLEPEKRLVILEKYIRYVIAPLSSIDVHASVRSMIDTLTDDQLDELAERVISLNEAQS
ncbi:MAG TPA: hypothetical protein P5531_06325 [Bacteroidales bacterium]|nr:hypothetical protein [Bacteroidales bacterium]HSA43747.1 hypothetical protein [Bacteroidales bacterium]